MKRKLIQALVFALSFMLISLSLNFSALAAEERSFLYPADLGDVNGDRAVTAFDARAALRISANLLVKPSSYMLKAADFNNDGKVSASDARSILRVSASLAVHPFTEKKALFKEALDLYVEVMNKAKADRPAYSMIFYLEAPNDKDNRKLVIEDDELREIFEDLMEDAFNDFEFDDEGMSISRDDALKEKELVAKGSDMKSFPLEGRDEGALAHDYRLLKDAAITELANGNIQLKIVFNDEKNPLPLEEAVEKGSFTSLVFKPMGGISELMPDLTMDYHHFDCTAIIEYKPSSREVVSLKHEVNASLIFNMELKLTEDSEGFIFGLLQNIYSSYEWFDFEY